MSFCGWPRNWVASSASSLPMKHCNASRERRLRHLTRRRTETDRSDRVGNALLVALLGGPGNIGYNRGREGVAPPGGFPMPPPTRAETIKAILQLQVDAS